MQLFIDSLLRGWDRNLDYAKKLVADLSDKQMVAMPQAADVDGVGCNHPAWIFSHLNVYHPVLVAMLTGQSFDDPKHAPFGMLTRPEPDVSVYPDRVDIMASFEQGHIAVTDALRAVDEAALNRDMPLERWQTPFPKVGSMLGYLMLVHESTHLGQISAWRRVQGLPSV